MKKSLLAAVFASLVLVSCQSNRNSGYDFAVTDDGSASQEKGGNGGATKKFTLFDFGKGRYIETDETSVFSTTAFGNIKQQAASILINPKTKLAGFGSKYMAAYYVVQLDAEGRDALRKAVDSYLDDFENKRLDRKDGRSYKKYGDTPVRIEWGTIKASTPNYAEGKIQLGYKFKDKSPYFTLTAYSMPNIKKMKDESAVTESLPLSYYMTKAQATSLVSLLDENMIAEALNEQLMSETGTVQEADSYGDEY